MGDEVFYRELYGRCDFHRALNAPGLARAEFRRVAEVVRAGEKVLDVVVGMGKPVWRAICRTQPMWDSTLTAIQ